jgi:hypothetical protein
LRRKKPHSANGSREADDIYHNHKIAVIVDPSTWNNLYLRHRVGVNNTRMVKTSNRPSNIAAEQTQVWKSLKTP